MNFYSYRIIIEPDDPSGFHGFVPLLGVHTCGDTIEETKANLHEGIICHLQGLKKDGIRIPQESDSMEIIQTFSEADLMTA